ncbi:MAG: hypothetical protein HQK51_00185 [Oligoflexia bacterium]|nr:hypothetical protein [Oligoflexia bacterium]
MNFKIGYLCSEKSLLINIINTNTAAIAANNKNQNVKTKISASEIKSENLNMLLFSSDLQSEDVAHILEEENKYYPVWPANSFNIKSEDDFDNFTSSYDFNNFNNFNKSDNSLLEVYSKWIICNNIKLLDNFFIVLEHLRSLLESDRTSFFEELWQILKSNLGTTYMRIIYHDLLPVSNNTNVTTTTVAPTDSFESIDNQLSSSTNNTNKAHKERTNEQVKNLITMLVEGERKPLSCDGKELENHLLAIYGEKCTSNFYTPEISLEKNEFLSLGLVRKTPVIILWRSFIYNKLQQSLIKALFDGLKYD